MHIDRRRFLGLSLAGATLAGLGMPLPVAHAAEPGDLKFVFVFASGGWDPTRVFATEFDNPNVDMEPDAERATAGNIAFVDHASRPNVRAFFEAHHARSVVLNGVMVRSIAHEICTMIAMTGTTSGLGADWPAALASASTDRFALPHLVLDGPSFPGDQGVAVARTGANGQMDLLLDGRAAMIGLPEGVQSLRRPSQDRIDSYLLGRAAARADASGSTVERELTTSYLGSLQRANELKTARYAMDFTGGGGATTQVPIAVDALRLGLCRCVTMGTAAFDWDTHANNDQGQSPLWNDLFGALSLLLAELGSTPGEAGGTLADETVVVVMSEMGRTPLLNGTLGKDHWPYTSTLLIGPNLQGDRVIGGFDDSYYGLTIDPASGDATESGTVLSAESVGATLLAMADVDPAPFVSGVQPIRGILS